MWMQDRYYKNYGVITGFMTNLQVLDIEAPENYSEKSVLELDARVEETAETAKPLYKESYAATADASPWGAAAQYHLCDERIVLGCLPPGGHIL